MKMIIKQSAHSIIHNLPPLPTIRDLIRLYKLRALKQLSQNFLMDLRLTNKIVKAAGRVEDCEVLEVGPGPGGITRSIIGKKPRRLIVLEKDVRFRPALEVLQDCSPSKMDIIYGDVMTFDMSEIFSSEYRQDWNDSSPKIHLIGNLPFSVATGLIIKWLHAISERRSAWSYGRTKMTLTFQKEVAERMVAPILSKQRCRLSVMCQNWCHVNHKFTIPGTAFVPQPEVDVGVVHFTPLVKPIIPLDFKLVEKVIRTIFNFRQKHSVKSARNLFPEQLRDELAAEMYHKADLDPNIRAFQITTEEYGRLCYAYKEICDRDPRLYSYNHRGSKEDRETAWLNEDDDDNICIQPPVQYSANITNTNEMKQL